MIYCKIIVVLVTPKSHNFFHQIFIQLMSKESDSPNPICKELRSHVLSWFTIKFPQDKELAEDLTQEVLLRLTQNFANVKEDLKGYLRGIMLHVFSDYLRGSYRKPNLVSLEKLIALKDHEGNSPFRQELSEGILEAVQKLPKKSIRIIMLRYRSDLRINEIAAVLGMKESAVKMQLKRAMEKLRTLLKKSDFF